MTDFMTALPVILVQPTCPGHQRARGVQFQSTCNLCRESHKVWLCFLVLSFLSTSTCAAPEPKTRYLQEILENKILKDAIERSDAMLYAPSSNEVKGGCEMMSLKCYILELRMVITEEEITGSKANAFFDFVLPEVAPDGCPPCESYSLNNIAVFMERLNTLLQKMKSRHT